MAGIGGQERFVQSLSEAQEKGQAVAVYSDCEDFQSYEVGFIEHVDPDELVLQCLSPRGEPDGRTALRMDQVIRIDLETTYTKKLELLHEYRSTLFDKDFRPAAKRPADLRAQLEHACANRFLVHLTDATDVGPSGFVLTVGEDFVELERVGTNGEPDGLATVLLSSIGRVHIARKQEQLLEFLYRYNFELKRLIGS